MEEWRKSSVSIGLEVSSLGRVRSCHTGKIRATTIDNAGYYRISNYSKITKKTHNRLLHRLIAIEFIPNPMNLYCVNHIDKNRKNNAIYNLEWVTTIDNNLHGLRGKKRGAEKTKWGYHVRIAFKGKRYDLGYYKEIDDAHEAYRAKYLSIHNIEPW